MSYMHVSKKGKYILHLNSRSMTLNVIKGARRYLIMINSRSPACRNRAVAGGPQRRYRLDAEKGHVPQQGTEFRFSSS
jgi:hypothetical protein